MKVFLGRIEALEVFHEVAQREMDQFEVWVLRKNRWLRRLGMLK